MGYSDNNEDMKGSAGYVGWFMFTHLQRIYIYKHATHPNIGLAMSQLTCLRGPSGANHLSVSFSAVSEESP